MCLSIEDCNRQNNRAYRTGKGGRNEPISIPQNEKVRTLTVGYQYFTVKLSVIRVIGLAIAPKI